MHNSSPNEKGRIARVSLSGALGFLLCALLLAGCTEDQGPTAPEPYPTPRHGDTTTDALSGVKNLTVANDEQLWGTVKLSWDVPAENAHGLSVSFYAVAMNPDGGQIDDTNWFQMRLLAEVATSPDTVFTHTFDNRDGIPPGSLVTFAVRPYYEPNKLGGLGPAITITPKRPHRQGGQVYDDLGQPLANVTVRLLGRPGFTDPRGYVDTQITDDDGRFAPLGPLSEDEDLILQTESPDELSAPGADDAYFDYRTGPLGFGSHPNGVDLYLITRLQPSAEIMVGAAVNYQQILHKLCTTQSRLFYQQHTIYKWDPAEFPLGVHIPADLDGGQDFAEVVRTGLTSLNEALGAAVFYETATESEAKIRVSWETGSTYGRVYGYTGTGGWVNPTAMLAPPLLMKVELNTGYDNEPYAIRAVQHEFSHALGIYQHLVHAPGYLMSNSGVGQLQDEEIRLLRSYLALPGVVDFSGYEESFAHEGPY